MCEANLAIQIDRRRFCLGVRGFINISELNLPCKWCTHYDENYYLNYRKIFGEEGSCYTNKDYDLDQATD